MVASLSDPGENRGLERFTNSEFNIELIPSGESFKVVASGVAHALGFHAARDMLRTVPDEEKGWELSPTPGGEQEVHILLEAGFYRVIGQRQAKRISDAAIRSRVERFQAWVYGDVLPNLRKHGRYEVAAAPPAMKEITAAAGPRPYKEQAEIVVLFAQAGVLPESYATATAKIIVARAMGERPELESSETPLYAATFLAEKGHKPKTVAKFQSGFGSRVSNRYFKVHGRRPEKIPGPAGSRIDKVAVYTEDDRPVLEQVYAEIVDLINAFENGGQNRLIA
ncbi:BRO family protein [Streptomyces sp. NPDC006872]|uniref:BRO-N domain-containing protein n=1 Tax=Streptomyces sp. NPDC006872 TaxID=3155720 RepID=UPI0033F24AFB